MKASYRIFSAHPLLTVIALFFLVTALAMIGWGLVIIYRFDASYFTTEIIVFLPALLAVLLMNIWLLTSSILPIVKINSQGIMAYSIFWKRTIPWSDVKVIRLLKVKNRYARYGTFLEFEDTQYPEKKRIAGFNKGYAVNTFIIVSDMAWQKPKKSLVRAGIYNHQIIAGRHAIAFEYEQQIWKFINDSRL